MKRGEPAEVKILYGGFYQKVFKENVDGSQIDNSHACFLLPSSDKLGVDGRKDCLLSVHHCKLQPQRAE